MIKINVSSLLLFLFAGSLHAQEINTAKLDSFFNTLAENNKAMGSFAIAKKGKVIYQKTIGYRIVDGEKKIPAKANTQYRIGSITKTFTAVLIFQLIEQGKLSMDTRIDQYFPELPGAKLISIADLLKHTSGLYDYVNDIKDQTWVTVPRSKTELMTAIKNGKTHFEPGKGSSYCNSGYLLLGYLIEKLTGKPYPKVVAEKIFNKLGMKNSQSGLANNTGIEEARAYHFQGKWTDVKDIYFGNVVGVGDILSTPTDLLRFIEALDAGKLLSSKSLSSMKSGDGPNTSGMGLFEFPFYSKKGYGHNGGTYGSFSVVQRFGPDSLAMAICTNGLSYPLNDINIAMLNVVYKQPFELPSFKKIAVAAKDLDPLLGLYSSTDMPLKITITRKEDILMGQATGQDAFQMEALGNNSFKFDPSGLMMEFNPEKGLMLLKQGGKTFRYAREK